LANIRPKSREKGFDCSRISTGRHTDRQTDIADVVGIILDTPPIPKVKLKYINSVTKSSTIFPYSFAVHTIGRLVMAFAFDIPG
jgi:putative ribosome biogenesis GTPase RsgA